MTVIQRFLKSYWCLGGHFDTGAIGFHQMFLLTFAVKEALIKSFDRLRTNGNILITFVVSLSNHECNQLNQSFLKAEAK